LIGLATCREPKKHLCSVETMNPDRFVKVFDVLDSGYADWAVLAFGLFFVVFGIVVLVIPQVQKPVDIPFLNIIQSDFQKVTRFLFLPIGIVVTAALFSNISSRHERYFSLVEQGACNVAEGFVEHFVPMPDDGHGVESFSVSGAKFSYSDYRKTGGFNNASTRGGPIKSNSYVRICYDPLGNVILRLEIRDFEGQPEDYGQITRAFPGAQDIAEAGENILATGIGWYIVVLYLLDLGAIQKFFLPYLRTSLRVKAVSGCDWPIRTELEAGAKIELRSAAISWDREDHAIWLRPRGFNLLKNSSAVARLTIGIKDRSILGYEIRLSAGYPVLWALLTYVAWSFLSQLDPASRTGPPLHLITVFGAMAILGGFLNLRTLRSRMERLVDDAVTELNGT
jgi:hypothetical protein